MRHRFHAICPYFAMFPEAFVETWIERLTKPGDHVLDPFCGRGTTPFQALLMDRGAVAGDINPVAFCITKAKTNAPQLSSAKQRITELEKEFRAADYASERQKLPVFFRHAYQPAALSQILHLRDRLKWRTSNTDAMVAALILGALHGESHKSPSYLSNQMPRTISTKPGYSVRFWRERGCVAPERDAFALLRRGLDFRYQTPPPEKRAKVLNCDMRELAKAKNKLPRNIQCAITSPPYLDVTRFEEDQWLRLWFLGGPPHPTYCLVSKDDRHSGPGSYLDLLKDLWSVLGRILAKDANVVVRLGGKGLADHQLVGFLSATSAWSKRKVELLSHDVSRIKRRQTDSFRPGSTGCRIEVDCHFLVH